MRIRPYEPSDLSSLIETYTASIHTLAAAHYSPEQIMAWAPLHSDPARWRERLLNLQTLVAESDGMFAGFASFTREGYLDFLFTYPAFARRGVASKLYRQVESALRGSDVRSVTAHSSLAARPFFERHGFVVDTEESIECRGVFLRRFAMSKQLDKRVTRG